MHKLEGHPSRLFILATYYSLINVMSFSVRPRRKPKIMLCHFQVMSPNLHTHHRPNHPHADPPAGPQHFKVSSTAAGWAKPH